MPINRDTSITMQREHEVASLLLLGYSNREIGKKLRLTTRTVKAYMGRMFRRYNITEGNKRIRLVTLLAAEARDK